MRKVLPYLLVVAAAWGGSYLWYTENEERRDAAVQAITQEQFSEDVDSCRRVNYGVRHPVHQFFKEFAKITELSKASEEERNLYQVVLDSVDRTVPRDCDVVVGQPPPETTYDPDADETHGIPDSELP